MDRQKKWPHYNMTGKESRKGTRALTGLPWEAAEVPEDYFSSQDIPPEKCRV